MGCRRRLLRRKATLGAPPWRGAAGVHAVADPEHVRKHSAREPGDPASVCCAVGGRPHREVTRHTPMMHARGKSDTPIVPRKPPNNAARAAAEAVEGRGVAEGNSL